MTERFKSINCGLQGQYIKDNGIVLTIDEVVKLLNELHEENVKLKQFRQNVFGLIDKSLEKNKHDYEMTYEDDLNGRIEVLEDLKKELLDD